MHVFAFWTVASYANVDLASETSALVGITGSLLLSWSLLLVAGDGVRDARVLFAALI
jgi:hypothetical protein